MVLAKSGNEGSWVMAAISAEWSAKACSKAGMKCSGAISAKGGVSNGVCQAANKGLACSGAEAVFSRVSDITNPDFVPIRFRPFISRDRAFFQPFALDGTGLYGEIAPLKQAERP